MKLFRSVECDIRAMAWMLAMALAAVGWSSTAKADPPVRVGVYAEGAGAQGVMQTLADDARWQAQIFNDLTPEAIEPFDVLVFSNTRALSPQSGKPLDVLTQWVAEGRGVLFTHNAVGRWGVFKDPLFPIVARFDDRIESQPGLQVSDANHPIAADMPERFAHHYADHMAMRLGPAGHVVVQDAEGDAVVVTGEPMGDQAGRVAFIGSIPGWTFEEKPAPETGANRTMLFNTLRWLADGTHADPAEADQRVQAYLANRQQYLADHPDPTRVSGIDPTTLPLEPFKWKGIYVFARTYPGLYTRDAVRLMVRDAKRMGINALYVEMVGGCVFYLSQRQDVEIYAPYKDAGFDLLKVVCEEAHKEGLQVLALVHPFEENIDGQPTQYSLRRPEYLQVSRTTDLVDGSSASLPSGCPDRPEVRERALGIIREIVTRYPVDGISLDYIRYMNDRCCYCDYSLRQVEQYAHDHPELTAPEARAQFSEQTITDFVVNIREILDETRPGMTLHAYTHPAYAFKWPLDYHSRRTTSALWTRGGPAPGAFASFEQTFIHTRKLIADAQRYRQDMQAAPQGEIQSGWPPDAIRDRFRTIRSAGADCLSVMGYALNYKWFANWYSSEPVKRAVSHELGGEWVDLELPPLSKLLPDVPPQPNLLADGSFEQMSEAGAVPFDLPANAQCVTTQAQHGEHALKLTGSGSLAWPAVPVTAGQTYTASAWFKTNGEQAVKVSVVLRYLDERGDVLRVHQVLPPDAQLLEQWYRIGVTRTASTPAMLNADTQATQAQVVVQWDTSGVAYLDCVQLEAYPIATSSP